MQEWKKSEKNEEFQTMAGKNTAGYTERESQRESACHRCPRFGFSLQICAGVQNVNFTVADMRAASGVMSAVSRRVTLLVEADPNSAGGDDAIGIKPTDC